MPCWGGNKTNKNSDAGTQCQRNWNADPSALKSTSSVTARQTYRHLFLIRHGKYHCKETLSEATSKTAAVTPSPSGTLLPPIVEAGANTSKAHSLYRSDVKSGASLAPPNHPRKESAARQKTSSRARGTTSDCVNSNRTSSRSQGNLNKSANDLLDDAEDAASDGDKILEGSLTDVGRRQIQATATRLKELSIDFDKIYVSSMERAKESANIIAGILCMMDDPIEDELLNEGTFPPEPMSLPPSSPAEVEAMWNSFPAKKRFESAFRKFFSKPEGNAEDVFEIIVCHCNIIKFFVHKALGLDALGLKRFSNVWFPSHASITILSVAAQGGFFLRTLGDCGHLQVRHVTVNNLNSDVFWNSWMQPLQLPPPRPTPLTSNLNDGGRGRSARRDFHHQNTTNHATDESDFCPSLGSFEALIIGKDRAKTGEEKEEEEEEERKWSALDKFRRRGSSSANSLPDPPISWNRLSFEDYRDCCNQITRFIREREGGSIPKPELRDWILSQRDTLLKDRQLRGERVILTRVVVDRLIDVDLVLIQSADETDTLSVHPNFREA